MAKKDEVDIPPNTPMPEHDIANVVPEVVSQAKTMVRLHPLRNKVKDAKASKIGAPFAWPNDEPWPTCPSAIHAADTPALLVPVLQLRNDDVPELVFPEGKDLFQLFWCADAQWEEDHDEPLPQCFWRSSEDIVKVAKSPKFETAAEEFIPKTCELRPERVLEYPDIDSLDYEIQERVSEQELGSVYQFRMSLFSGTKVGGYAHGSPKKVTCEEGHEMEFLLQLTDSEYVNTNEHHRWIPEADRWIVDSNTAKSRKVNNPAGCNFGHSVYVISICRQCDGWPIRIRRS